jgi:hypothetical protein
MILQFDKTGNFVAMYAELPKGKGPHGEWNGFRVHDIKRCTLGILRSTRGYQWREVKVENLSNDNNTGQ